MERHHDLIGRLRPAIALSGPVVVWTSSLLCGLLFIAVFKYRPPDFVLEMSVRTQSCAFLQLQPVSDGREETQDLSVQLVDSRQKFKCVRFNLHADHLDTLHLSLFRGSGSIELRDIKLRDVRRRFTIPIPSASLTAENDIATITSTDAVTRVVSTPAASWPKITMRLPHPLFAARVPDWIAILLTLALGVSLVWLLALSPQAHDQALQAARGLDARPWIITGLFAAYIISVLANLNGSSTAIWQYYADGELPQAGLVAGSAKEIRSDEWMVQTPWIFSQAKQIPAFPVTNPNVGDGVAPLLTNLPARHWSMLFRPQMWGFFCLRLDRAFSLNWNFKWFGLLLGGFIFFELLTQGNWLVSLGGAVFLLFSSYTQWWFSTPTDMPEMIAMVFFGLWSCAMILRAATRWKIVAAAVVLLVAIEQFAFCCYPRFQVPLLYFALAVTLGFAWVARLQLRQPDELRLFRFSCLTITLLVAAALLGRWAFEISATVREIAGLIYPGRVFSSGGESHWTHFLAPFLEFGMTEDHYPAGSVNVCAAAGFLFLAPLLFVAVGRDAWRKRSDPLLVALVVFIGFDLWFMALGVPRWLAGVTGWSYVTSSRATLALGIATVAAVVRYLGRARVPLETPIGRRMLGAGILTLALYGLLTLTNIKIGAFALGIHVVAVALYFAVTFYCLWSRRAVASCLLLAVPMIFANALVNPISHGLPGLTKGAVFRWVESRVRESRNDKWLVAGSSIRSYAVAQLVKAAGANTLGGTRCTPDRALLRQLDPDNRAAAVHDRYGRACFVPANVAAPTFKLWFVDAYTVELPLNGPMLSGLGIDNLLLIDEKPVADTLVGWAKGGAQNGCYLYARRPY